MGDSAEKYAADLRTSIQDEIGKMVPEVQSQFEKMIQNLRTSMEQVNTSVTEIGSLEPQRPSGLYPIVRA